MMHPDEVRAIVLAALPDAEVEVRDLTGTRDHFQVVVVSPAFEGKSLIERHRMVQEPLRPAVEDGRIHALTLKTAPPAPARQR